MSHDARTAERSNVANRGFSSRRLRVRTLLLVLVLVPTVGMVTLASVAAATARAEQRSSERVHDGAEDLGPSIEALAAVANEEISSSVVTVSRELGLDLPAVSEVLGIDYATVVADARAAVDQNELLRTNRGIDALHALRAAIDDGTASFTDVTPVFRLVVDDVRSSWETRMERIALTLDTESLPGDLHTRVEAIRGTFDALRAGNVRATIVSRLVLQKTSPSDLSELVAATTRYDNAVEQFVGRLGSRGTSAWTLHVDDDSAARFEATLDRSVEVLMTNGTLDARTDAEAISSQLADADRWATTLTDTVTATVQDLQESAAGHADDAVSRLQLQVGAALLLTLLAVGGAAYLARSVARPIRRLEAAAHSVHQGHFDLSPLDTDGPKELARTAAAFNEMTATLASVEAHAVALADDPDDEVLSEELPGRTGRALQVALNRLRSSIRVADQQRSELQQLATHDSLTGLLNRAAAFEMIERDLSRSRREGGLVMALFIDLDGLKLINDQHGHAAGDDALRLTAAALRASTRESDIVARLGGDEFLVAGMVLEEAAEVGRLAERVLASIGQQAVETVDGPIPLRCSIGVAVTKGGIASTEELVHHADSALYAAKRSGRNRVAWHDPASAASDEARTPHR